MDQAYRKILQKNIVPFKQNMVSVSDVVDYLFGEDVLSESMRDDILGNGTERNRASALHMLIPKRGQRAFEFYYQALRHTQNHDLADILEPSIAKKRRIPRESATSGGATGHTSSNSKQPEQSDQIVPDDLPDVWPDVTINPLDVQVNKEVDSVMEKLFQNDREVYSMKGRKTGVRVLIINNKTFQEKATDTQERLDERDGTDIDATALDLLFKDLGFQVVETKSNLKGKEIESALANEAKKCKVTDNAFICVILSHGTIGSVYGVDGEPVKLQQLYDQFNGEKCPNMARKPKIFFIQACQGGKKDGAGKETKDKPEEVVEQLSQLTMEDERTDSSVDSPTMADILVATATTKGYVSWRNSMSGSWFIQALVYTISKYAFKCDILTILTKAQRLIGSQATKSNGYKQCAETRSTLLKQFYFFPGFEESESIFG